MFAKNVSRILSILILLACTLLAQSASATFHLWKLSEIYSDSTGNVQYIVLSTSVSGQQFLTGHEISTSWAGSLRQFNFTSDLPGDSAGRKFLISTQGFANLGIVAPDYVIPDGFLFLPNGTVNFAGVDSMTYNALPIDGVLALSRGGTSVVNAPTNFAGATGSIPPATPTPAPAVYQGLWWNPNESGWGMSITQHRNILFSAIYTYDQTGLPLWFVIPSCLLAGTSCTGDIYKVSGGTPPTVTWNGTGKNVTFVGVGSLNFFDASNATFNFAIDGKSGSKTITQQIFATGSNPPATDFSDLWWNPNESGWGVALTQQFGTIFATWYSYDTTGKAIWYVASNCPMVGSGCSADLYRVNGGSPITATWNGANKTVTKVGTIAFAFTDSNNGNMTYTIDGATGVRAITRQGF
jgi:hypothetical protein